MSDELDTLLDDDDSAEPVEAPEPEAAEAAAPEPEASDVEGEKPAEPAAPEPPSGESEHQPVHVPIEALVAEREKRQEYERKLKEYEARAAEPQKLPDVIEDPDGFVSQMQARFEEARVQDRIAISRMVVSSARPDFAEKEAAFMQLAEGNPLLVEEMMRSENPAEYAYETARKHAEWSALQDVDSAKAKLRAEVEAEIRAEMKGELQTEGERKAQLAKAAGIPNLATATGASGTPATPSDDDLGALLDGR